MPNPRTFTAGTAAVTVAVLLLGACDRAADSLTQDPQLASTDRGGPRPELENSSVTPPLLKNLAPGVKAYSVIGSDDVLPDSPGFVFGGSADGLGLLGNGDGSFTLLINHEDNFSVSRIGLDRSFRPRSGEYVVNSTFGLFRLCSATLVTPEEHGFGPLYLTAGESGPESQIHAVAPDAPANTTRLLPALGQWSAENAVPLPAQAFPGRTVVVIGDDDSGPEGGQLALYVGKSIGDLDGGDLYVLARPNDDTREKAMVAGESYPVEFRRIPNQKVPRAGGLNADAATLNAVAFGRVEDVDYRKSGDGREIYFVVTGQEGDENRSKYGRLYRLRLDAQNPLAATLEVLLDGDDRDGPAGTFQNPDGILVTRNYVYIGEDPNGYRDETHDAYLYQYDIASRQLAVVAEIDHRRDAPDAAKYNPSGPSAFGAWEYGAVVDVSHLLGGNGSDATFLVAIQPHTWRDAKYKNPDGGSLRPNENQASQLLLLTGLPR